MRTEAVAHSGPSSGRINSQANLILTEGNTWLSDEEMEKLVVLRMNRKFMSFMLNAPQRRSCAYLDDV